MSEPAFAGGATAESAPLGAAPPNRSYPGAQAPDRQYRVDVGGGLHLAVHEWGPADGSIVFAAHGGFDFARTYDVFAPLFAREGWRFISWDQRGHGDSDKCELYSWDADLRDALALMTSITHEPRPVIGHSKGGSLMLQGAEIQPFRFSCVVNFDGIPSRRPAPDVADHDRTRLLAGEFTGWLDHRRSLIGKERKPGTIKDLARRRGRMNPRMSQEWLEYLVTVGASESADGWRWKIEPSMRFGGFGPWKPEWAITRLPGLTVPFLGILATVLEEMGWGTSAGDVTPFLPPEGRVVELPDTGHFVHIERPHEVAALVLPFIEAHR